MIQGTFPAGAIVVLRKGVLQTAFGLISIGDHGEVVRSDPEHGTLVRWLSPGFTTWCGVHDGCVIELVKTGCD